MGVGSAQTDGVVAVVLPEFMIIVRPILLTISRLKLRPSYVKWQGPVPRLPWRQTHKAENHGVYDNTPHQEFKPLWIRTDRPHESASKALVVPGKPGIHEIKIYAGLGEKTLEGGLLG